MLLQIFGRRQQQRSLFGEILDWMLIPMLLMWPLTIGITWLVAQALAAKPYDQALGNALAVLAAEVRAHPAGGEAPAPDWRVALQQLPLGGLRAYQVRAADGRVLAGDPALPMPGSDRGPATAQTLADDEAEPPRLRTEEVDGEELRVASRWVALPRPGGRAEVVLLQVAQTLDGRKQLSWNIVQGVIAPQLLMVPVSIFLVWFGLGQGIAPLNETQARIRRRRADDLSPIDEREAPEEIAPLVDSINGLLARLAQSIQTQRRFVADAAHQMKTPLAGLRTQAELAQRQTDPEELRASLRQISKSVERTTRLVNQLLALTRAENQAVVTRAAFTRVDLRQPATEAMKDLAMLALDKRLELGLDSPERPLPVLGNALLLQELVKNLLDNAITYTPAGGSVTLRLYEQRNDQGQPQVVLEVDDDGPGIPPAERELVFEPFYRILDNGAEGSGLGLAIVREIARQHQASIELGERPGRRGLRVRVSLPRAPS